jgi:hypothetical protein
MTLDGVGPDVCMAGVCLAGLPADGKMAESLPFTFRGKAAGFSIVRGPDGLRRAFDQLAREISGY